MSVSVHDGDCIVTMRRLISEGVRVQTIVTSPPYFGLRDYGTATWEGGAEDCGHIAGRGGNLANSAASTRGGANKVAESQAIPFRGDCGKCGAVRIDQQIGLESSPAEFIAKLVDVFDVARELLADDGTLWVNMGDSYAAARGGTTPPAETLAGGIGGHGDDDAKRGRKGGYNPARDAGRIGYKHKDLMGIPWRLAFALQDAGWYLRQDIIWAKPNPMPESVTDRCTKAHEYLFLLSKQPRYYFDAEAIAEQSAGRTDFGTMNRPGRVNEGGAWQTREPDEKDTRNKRSVWTVATQPFSEAHFATFPPALIEPCILAGSRPGDLVLDPFGGAGTTGLVSDRLGRSAILCELNPDYAAMARRRIFNDAPLFAEVA